MKCKFCGDENFDVNALRDHMTDHVSKYGGKKLTVRQFLLCVQLFYGELPDAGHIREATRDAEMKVDQAMKEMQITV